MPFNTRSFYVSLLPHVGYLMCIHPSIFIPLKLNSLLVIFKNSDTASQGTYSISTARTTLLMVYGEITAVYSVNLPNPYPHSEKIGIFFFFGGGVGWWSYMCFEGLISAILDLCLWWLPGQITISDGPFTLSFMTLFCIFLDCVL